jgi:hypothetical protein
MKTTAGTSKPRILAVFASLGLVLPAIYVSAAKTPQTAEIRVPTRLVQIGVIARDSAGPVSDLTKDGFVVLDRGKPRKISVFTVEALPAGATALQPAKTLPQKTPSPIYRNMVRSDRGA